MFEDYIIALVAGALLLLLYLFFFSKKAQVTPSADLAVVVSGCDSGFGEGVAERLSAKGFTVFAGCLTASGVRRWKGVANVKALPLDVTSEKSVADALRLVEAWVGEKRGGGSRSLHALVNNAGIGTSGLVDWHAFEGFKKTMDVNFLGHVCMTKAFLPLLMGASAAAARVQAPRPRVVNITSVAGLLAAPGLSAYCASKYALEAFSDALRREMAPWRLGVAIIEPSFLATPILHNVKEKAQALWDSLPAATQVNWGPEYFEATLRRSEKIIAGAEPPSLGVDAIERAVLEDAPSARYRAGTPGKTYLPFIAALPAFLADPIIEHSAPTIIPAGMQAAE